MQNRLRRSIAAPARPHVVAVLVVACALALGVAPAASAHNRHHHTAVTGSWTNPLGACVDHVVTFDPATGDFTCTGTSDWTGTWTGSTTWTVAATQDLATGATSGRIEEAFTGRATDGRRGTLVFVEHFTLDAAGNIDIWGRIVASSGSLTGSRGHARWIGTSSATDGSGRGTYSGRWHEGGGHRRR